MTAEQQQIRMDIISQLLDYYAKIGRIQTTTEELINEAIKIEAWVSRGK